EAARARMQYLVDSGESKFLTNAQTPDGTAMWKSLEDRGWIERLEDVPTAGQKEPYAQYKILSDLPQRPIINLGDDAIGDIAGVSKDVADAMRDSFIRHATAAGEKLPKKAISDTFDSWLRGVIDHKMTEKDLAIFGSKEKWATGFLDVPTNKSLDDMAAALSMEREDIITLLLEKSDADYMKPPLARGQFPSYSRAIDENMAGIEGIFKRLEEGIEESERRKTRWAYQRERGVSDRTVRNYLKRYREQGSVGLLFHRCGSRPLSPRIHDEALGKKILSLIEERPRRTVPQLRRILTRDPEYRPAIERISDRTIYRFLNEQGLSQKQRAAKAIETGRRSFHQFQASASMELVQGDARDGIWLPGVDGAKTRKTYLFLWVDDFSRRILSAQYFWDEKLPRMEHTFKTMILRWGIPNKTYLDNGNVYIAAQFALGWEGFMTTAALDPQRFERHFWVPRAEISRKHAEALCRTDEEVVFVHDDLTMTTGPVFAPEFYERYI
ncbi:hypothetical protein LCGC14_2503280, partial [marine sediment metagenome]